MEFFTDLHLNFRKLYDIYLKIKVFPPKSCDQRYNEVFCRVCSL